jgi:AcrR family transcriptional regulator
MPAPGGPEVGGLHTQVRHRICVAAMKCFGAFGTQATGLRLIAKTAGVSVGLLQQHFRTKAVLIEAVDEELVAILRRSAPSASAPADPFADAGYRLTTMIAEYPDAIDYLAHVLIDDQQAGRRIFDLLLELARAQWDHLADQGVVRPGVDPTWGALNPLILMLGTMILRSHIERQLPETLDSPAQLQAWESALYRLIAGGQLREPPRVPTEFG